MPSPRIEGSAGAAPEIAIRSSLPNPLDHVPLFLS
jgi:hypothetical protein